MKEKWRTIPGFEGRYKVSNKGRIKSLSRVVKRKTSGDYITEERIIKLCKDRHGYYVVTLCKPPKTRIVAKVHRLVLLAFIGKPTKDKYVCRHLDGNRKNNRIENLTYGTYQQNSDDRKIHGRNNIGPKGEEKYNALLKDSDIPIIRKMYKQGYDQKQIADKFKVKRPTIASIIIRKNWKHIK